MIKIAIENNRLKVEDQSGDIFNWKHRAFFNISLGFEVDLANNRYFNVNKNEFNDVLREVISYFEEEGLKYEVNEQVSNLISDIQAQELEFATASINSTKEAIIQNPQFFVRELKPYQQKGVAHFYKVGHAANFSVPGSGKTTMVYAYFQKLREEGVVNKIFVVGPFSSFTPWEEESEKCFGQKLTSARLVGTKRQSLYFQADKFDLFLCHYQTVANDVSEIIQLCRLQNILMVVDESHYIKGFEGGVWSNALLAIAPYAKRRVVLSGTPMPNSYSDLWTQFTFLWPGKQLLGDRSAYKRRAEDIIQQEEIRKQVKPFFYRVKKTDLKLPDPTLTRLEYALKPIQFQIYNALTVKLLSELKLEIDDRQKLKQWRKAKMVRLLQTASNPTLLTYYSEEFEVPGLPKDDSSLIQVIEKYSQFEIPAKIEAACELIKELLATGEKVLLWTTFVHNIKMVENLLKGVNYYSIHGAIPKDDSEDLDNRERRIQAFKSTHEPSVLIANPAACAESISLQEVCHHAIYLDRTFNCGQFIQSMDRIDRISRNPKPANYYILIAKGTIDETVDRRLEEKKKLMLEVLEDDIPIGTFELQGPEMAYTEQEAEMDFMATINDVMKNVAV